MLLEVTGLSKRFGGLVAVSNIDFAVREGEIRGVIGPNGSGKSTLFNLISGVYQAEPGGRVIYAGEDITDYPPHKIAQRGIARTFQLLRIFTQMSVLENLLIGYHSHVGYGGTAAAIGTGAVWAEERRLKDEMMELLGFIGLADHAEMPAGDLSIGQRRLLALGRAMAMRPKLLMLDEPAAGLSPVNVDKLLTTVLALKQRFGLTLIIIEHILKVVMESCETVTVLEHGEKIAEGPPAAIKSNHRVIEAYLGKEMGDAEVRSFLKAS
ncbi:MAG: ABC transporter ATP-binding protein [Rhodospirillales bacterium]